MSLKTSALLALAIVVLALFVRSHIPAPRATIVTSRPETVQKEVATKSEPEAPQVATTTVRSTGIEATFAH